MNNYKKLLAAALLTILTGFSAIAQERLYEVSGKVVDPYTNAPIEGALVGATGLTQDVSTDVNGEFKFEIPSLRGTLRVWAMGYYEQLIPLQGRSYFRVVLIHEDKLGYSETAQVPLEGLVPASSLISSSSYVDKKNININKTNVEQIFLSMPGIRVIDKSGMPGEGSYFGMRGIKSFTAENSPLIILNGMPIMYDLSESPLIKGYSRGVLNGISPKDVNNVTRLAGADAAVYGSMGSNGVIMIETDRAVDMETKVEFIGQYGINMNQVRMPLLSIPEYKNYVSSVAKTNYASSTTILSTFPFLRDDPEYYYKFLYNNNTDWQNEIYRAGFVTDNVLKIKGGDAIAKYDISAGYYGNAGQVDNTKFDKYFVRINSDVNLNSKISLSTTVSTSYMRSDLAEQGMSLETNPLLAAFRKSPMLSPFMKDADNNLRPTFENVGASFTSIYGAGNYGSVNNAVSNPRALVSDVEATSKVYDINANAMIKYTISDYITISGIAGMYYNLNREAIFIPGVSSKTIMPLDSGVANNSTRVGVVQTFNSYFSLNGAYKRTFDGLHQVSASVGAHMAMNNSEYDGGRGRNTATDFYRSLNNTTAIGRQFFGYNDVWNWMNFNVKGQYVYNNMIGVGAVLAADRSSATGADAQLFGFYPAVNVALYLKNTPMLNNVNFVNTLTLRGDFTVTGNSQYATNLSKYDYVGNRYWEVTGIVRAGVPNTRLRPEVISTASVALDASLLNYRVALTAEYYASKAKDLIMRKTISPAFGGYMYDNIGKVKNNGVELGLQVAVLDNKNFGWYVGATLNKNKNEIVSLGENSSIINEFGDGSSIISQVGKSMYGFYGLQTDGVYATTAEATADGMSTITGTKFQAGDVKFIDQNGDHIINSNDRVYLGDANPDFFGSISTTFRYKALELSALFGYSSGNMAYNAVRRQLESSSDYANQYQSVASRWINEGQVTNMPRASFGDPQGNNRFSDRFIEDASYIKLKELMISYKFPLMNGITVYAAGENLFTITNYLGLDPEFAYSYDPMMLGYDYAKIALPRTIKFGVKLQF